MLILIRHGEATANAAGQLLGRADVPLTPRGEEQVAALRPHLGDVRRLIASPLVRARRSAEGLGTGLEVELDGRWIEIDYGEHDGQALTQAPLAQWRLDPDYRPAGGESLAEVGARVRQACEELFPHQGDVVVVSHVSPIKAAVAWALDCDDSVAWRMHLSTGSITRIDWHRDAPVLETFNWVPTPVGTPPAGPR